MVDFQISPDTEVALLLTSTLKAKPDAQPLTLTEYNRVMRGLVERGMRPADLLNGIPDGLMEAAGDRLARLLGRGVALADARVAWSNRGIWVAGRTDEHYPQRIAEQLKNQRPPLFYGVGNPGLMNRPSFGMVGSRETSEDVLNWVQELAAERVALGEVVVSGGAKGVDLAAMVGALEAGGGSIGLLANDLAKLALSKPFRTPLREGNLLLLSASEPEERFKAWKAMERNKFIYSMSKQLVVVASASGTGGTWAGAMENLEHRFCAATFVRHDVGDAGLSALHRLGIPWWGAVDAAPQMTEWERIRRHLLNHGPDGLKNIRKAIEFPGKEGTLKGLLLERVESGDLVRKGIKYAVSDGHQGTLFE
jgi:hypothetical protein